MLVWLIDALTTSANLTNCARSVSKMVHLLLLPMSEGSQAYVDAYAVDAYALGGGFLQSRVLRAYVGGDGVDVGALNQQAATLKQVLESWFQQVSSL